MEFDFVDLTSGVPANETPITRAEFERLRMAVRLLGEAVEACAQGGIHLTAAVDTLGNRVEELETNDSSSS